MDEMSTEVIRALSKYKNLIEPISLDKKEKEALEFLNYPNATNSSSESNPRQKGRRPQQEKISRRV